MVQGELGIYLYFNNNCAQAIELYKSVFDAECTYLARFRDMPTDGTEDETQMKIDPDLVMHANLQIGDNQMMMSDEPTGNWSAGSHIALNWAGADADSVRQVWQRFIDAGATIDMPLEKTFFAELFGALTDPFGISWQIMLEER